MPTPPPAQRVSSSHSTNHPPTPCAQFSVHDLTQFWIATGWITYLVIIFAFAAFLLITHAVYQKAVDNGKRPAGTASVASDCSPPLSTATARSASFHSVAVGPPQPEVLVAVPRVHVPAKYGFSTPAHLAVQPHIRRLKLRMERYNLSLRSFNGLAFCSPLHARAPRNLCQGALAAMRSVGLDSGTLIAVWTALVKVPASGPSGKPTPTHPMLDVAMLSMTENGEGCPAKRYISANNM